MPYDQNWHVQHSASSTRAAKEILEIVLSLFDPKSYLELGAGFCHWARYIQDRGVSDILAVDGPWTDRSKIAIAADQFMVANFEAPFTLDRRFDLALSVEVAEHVMPEWATSFVDNLTNHADLILFGAAIPLQGGYRHVNERWPSYWTDLFAARGYAVYDLIRPRVWTDRSIPYFYRQNTLLYVKRERSDLVGIAEKEVLRLATAHPLDIVHPEKFIASASYESVSLRRLLPVLPARLFQAARNRAKAMLGRPGGGS